MKSEWAWRILNTRRDGSARYRSLGREFPEVIRNTKKERWSLRCWDWELGQCPFQIHCQTARMNIRMLNWHIKVLLQRYNGASKEEAEKLDPDRIIQLSDEVRERWDGARRDRGIWAMKVHFLIVQRVFIDWRDCFGRGVVARLVSVLRSHRTLLILIL